ncbi:MAG: DUF2917 domain-containing protein [Opitutus sp.]|nr:DUF2917 domain-containing protein [Opitutus sp.]
MRATFSTLRTTRRVSHHETETRSIPLFTRLARLVGRLRGFGRKLECFLVDFYRACSLSTASHHEPSHTRRLHLRRGELHTVLEFGPFSRLEVVVGEIWLTQDPTSGDLLLGPGSTFDLRNDALVVIEALQDTSLVIRATR